MAENADDDLDDGPAAEAEGGEAACWLHRLCPACGAVPSPPGAVACWRCGAPGPDLR